MKPGLLLPFLILTLISYGQNIGIGTTTPRGPLSFPPTGGQKIVLWDDGNAAGGNYGLGIQGGLLQIHTYTPFDKIVFGYGSSNSFTERMRIHNSGGEGMELKGRITLRNGTNPIDLGYGSGIWLYKPDNSAALSFIGVQNSQNVGFYGGPAGFGFIYDAINSRVGIGNDNPNAPLAFPAQTGKKITLYPGAQGNVGLGVYGNELRIHTDYEPADITFGYENLAGAFTERFRLKGNGAIAINGNTGFAGQVLTSNGNASPSWKNMPYTIVRVPQDDINAVPYETGGWNGPDMNNPAELFNMEMVVTIPAGQNARLLISGGIIMHSRGCVCSRPYARFYFTVNNVRARHFRQLIDGDSKHSLTYSNYPWDVGPGTYVIKWFVEKEPNTGAFNAVGVTPLYATTYVQPF